jgi:RNA polymerase sigma factor (sigma-70 family)
MTPAEYNDCVEEFSDNLYRFILKNIKDKDKAKDIVQDAFEKLWIKCPDLDFSKAKSWLFTTGYRIMIDLLRREQKQGNFEEVNLRSLTYERSYTGLNEILNQALNKLPSEQKSAILLRDYEGYSYKEIGHITGLSESQVKVYIFRARTFLKKELGSIEALI